MAENEGVKGEKNNKETGPKKEIKEKKDIKSRIEGTEEKLDEAIEEARRVEAKTEKLFFLTKLKKLSIVLGGSLLFVGFLLILGALLISFDILKVGALIGASPLNEKYKLLLTIGLGIQGVLDILGGLLLAGE